MIDVSVAYLNTSHKRLLHNLQERKIDSKVVDWIALLLMDCHAIIKTNKYTTLKLTINPDLLQKSPLSSILYLFYNGDVLNDCAMKRVDAQGYIDDMPLFAIGKSVKNNCPKLA